MLYICIIYTFISYITYYIHWKRTLSVFLFLILYISCLQLYIYIYIYIFIYIYLYIYIYIYMAHHFILLWLNPSSLIVTRDISLKTLCHSYWFICQKRVLKLFLGRGYLCLENDYVISS